MRAPCALLASILFITASQRFGANVDLRVAAGCGGAKLLTLADGERALSADEQAVDARDVGRSCWSTVRVADLVARKLATGFATATVRPICAPSDVDDDDVDDATAAVRLLWSSCFFISATLASFLLCFRVADDDDVIGDFFSFGGAAAGGAFRPVDEGVCLSRTSPAVGAVVVGGRWHGDDVNDDDDVVVAGVARRLAAAVARGDVVAAATLLMSVDVLAVTLLCERLSSPALQLVSMLI